MIEGSSTGKTPKVDICFSFLKKNKKLFSILKMKGKQKKEFAHFKTTTANQLAKFGKLIDKPVSNGSIDGLVALRGKIHNFSEVAILFLGNVK